MCGRYNLRASPAQLREFFDLLRDDGLPEKPRYNIPPTTQVPLIRNVDGQREAVAARWGLVPAWAKDVKGSAPLINARADGIDTKPSFRSAFKKRRCLIPASGFYEWRREGKEKIPFHIHQQQDAPLAFAGIWETWDKGEQPLESCAIITTEANPLMATIHDRMPVILNRDAWDAWMDPEVDPAALLELLVPYTGTDLSMDPANPLVNNVRNQGPECLDPAE